LKALLLIDAPTIYDLDGCRNRCRWLLRHAVAHGKRMIARESNGLRRRVLRLEAFDQFGKIGSAGRSCTHDQIDIDVT
jgi:hypothetical protein